MLQFLLTQIGKLKAAVSSLNSKLAPDFTDVTWNITNVDGDSTRKKVQKMGRLVVLALEFTPLSGKIANGNVICSNLPIPAYQDFSIGMAVNNSVRINSSGELTWYFPQNTSNTQRIDLNMVYFSAT